MRVRLAVGSNRSLIKMLGTFFVLALLGGCQGIPGRDQSGASSNPRSGGTPQLAPGIPTMEIREKPSGSSMLDGDLSTDTRKEAVSLQPIAKKGAGASQSKFPEDALLEVSIDSRGLDLETFFLKIAEEVLGLDLIVDQSLRLDGKAPTVSINGSRNRSEIVDLLLQTARASGFYAEIVKGSLALLPAQTSASSVSIGIGPAEADVPFGSDDVLQIVPLKNDWSIEIDRLVSELSGVELSRSNSRNAYVLRGNRRSVLRSLQIIEALDVPSIVGSHIRLVPLTFIKPEEAASEVHKLLASEGVRSLVVRGAEFNSSSSILLLPMSRLESILVFSAETDAISRVEYWVNLIDVPGADSERGFFTFRPRRIAADDLLASFSAIFAQSDSDQQPQSESGNASGPSTGQAPLGRASGAVITDDFRMVVDRNSGQIIINADQSVYEELLGILRKLDISPRQVLLEVLIAEVSLKDEFRLGFEWALNNRGVSYSTIGGFGANSFSGLSINLSKDKILSGKIFSSDNLIRVLSSPTLLVKEGEQASVSVGSQISVVGQTTFDPLVGGQRQTTAAEYLSTGVSVSFKPTLIGSDVIDLAIEQKISNTVAGSVGAAGNPDVFNRELKTEVLAQTGQTIFLGGLISERASSDRGGIPVLSRIPLLGSAFGTQGEQSDRTELVMLVTPTIFEDPSGWSDIYGEFRAKLRSIRELERMTDSLSVSNE